MSFYIFTQVRAETSSVLQGDQLAGPLAHSFTLPTNSFTLPIFSWRRNRPISRAMRSGEGGSHKVAVPT